MMPEPIFPIDTAALMATACEAGEAILKIYNNPLQAEVVKLKSDASPLTLADEASHAIITRNLHTLTPDIPVLSEEGRDIPYQERKNWEYYWCVDPLDGTKEFVNRNGEFTVNIALIHNQIPILGVIYVPVSRDLYFGSESDGSFKMDGQGNKTLLKTNKISSEWTAVGSRNHSSLEEEQELAKYPVSRKVSVGSSIKFCLLAEGLAQIYYRHGPTMEWDTAAGQAILTYSGGDVTTPEGLPFLYNKESLLNGPFLCSV